MALGAAAAVEAEAEAEAAVEEAGFVMSLTGPHAVLSFATIDRANDEVLELQMPPYVVSSSRQSEAVNDSI